jgi:hypothetical protein
MVVTVSQQRVDSLTFIYSNDWTNRFGHFFFSVSAIFGLIWRRTVPTVSGEIYAKWRVKLVKKHHPWSQVRKKGVGQ